MVVNPVPMNSRAPPATTMHRGQTGVALDSDINFQLREDKRGEQAPLSLQLLHFLYFVAQMKPPQFVSGHLDPLGCILRNWDLFDPGILRKKDSFFLCMMAWAKYSHTDGETGLTYGTIITILYYNWTSVGGDGVSGQKFFMSRCFSISGTISRTTEKKNYNSSLRSGIWGAGTL